MDGHVFLHVLVSPWRNHCESAGARTHLCHDNFTVQNAIILLLAVGPGPGQSVPFSRVSSFLSNVSCRFPAHVQQMLCGSMKDGVPAQFVVQVNPFIKRLSFQFIDFLFYEANRSFTTNQVKGFESLALHEGDQLGGQGKIRSSEPYSRSRRAALRSQPDTVL